jgi:RNA polymerase sigma-70 factor (ECF subfamily)
MSHMARGTGRDHLGATSTDEEFRHLFAASYPQLVRTVWFVVHDHQLAQDIAQEAFIELHRKWATVRSYERPDLWVRLIALRRAQREAAREVRRRRLEQASAPPKTHDGLELPDPALAAAIRSLPPQQRAVVALFYLEDRPMEEVAHLIGCSTATAYVHLHRARKRLATLLGEEVDDCDR